MFKSLIFLMSGLWLFLSVNTHACVVNNKAVLTFTVNEVIVPAGTVSKGDVIYQSTVHGINTTMSPGPCNVYFKYFKGTPTGDKYGKNDIYRTNVPGIGFALCVQYCDQSSISNDHSFFVGTETYKNGLGYNSSTIMHLVLVATGEPISSGSLEIGTYGGVGINSNESAVDLAISGGIIKATDCTIDSNKDIQVDFGPILSSSFGGAGSSSASKTFDVKMTCDGQANISVTLEGTQSPAGDATVLALSNQGDPQTSSGLGVQILYNGTPLTIGTPLPLKTTAGNVQELFQFGARYYQTGAQVTEGDANTTATLVITHQ